RRRHTSFSRDWSSDVCSSDLKAQIGMVIAGGSTPDTVCPAEACNVANLLGLEVPAFDVNSACTSFFALLNVVDMAQPSRLPEFEIGRAACRGGAERAAVAGAV